MFELDMTKEPESRWLTGVNLWEVRSAAIERAKSGEMMLVLKLKCGEYELKDRAMLGGGGWGIGRNKLAALGVSAEFKGKFDPLDFIGRKVWIATAMSSFEGIDKKTGEPRKFPKLDVDIDGLPLSGYQVADKIPPGARAPEVREASDDETPF